MYVWRVEFISETRKDLITLDNSQRIQVIKAIMKISANPLPAIIGRHLGTTHVVSERIGATNTIQIVAYIMVGVFDRPL